MRTELVVLATLSALLSGCADDGHRATGAPDAAVPVRVTTAELEAVPMLVTASGSTEAVRRVAPGTKIQGRIVEVAVREGEPVSRGQLLARLESRDLEAAVRQAEAAIAMARAELENARTQEERMRGLHSRGSVTEKGLEDATAALEVRRAALEQALANREAAAVELGYARIISPLDGWVVVRRVEAGDQASPGSPMFEIEDTSRIRVTVRVAESDVVLLEPGDAATVRVLERELPAAVARIVPAGDPQSRTFAVQLLLDNPDGQLKSGMFARAGFVVGERQVLRLPRAAVLRRGQLDGVFVVGDDSRARLRWVRLGPASEDRVEILSGLEPGERVVIEPPAALEDGSLLEVGT